MRRTDQHRSVLPRVRIAHFIAERGTPSAPVPALPFFRFSPIGTTPIVDARRGDGKRFIVHADEKLTAFLELQRVTRKSLRFPNVE